MAFQQGTDTVLNPEGALVSFIADNTCKEVMVCLPALISVDGLRSVAQRFCDIDNRVAIVVYYAPLNEYRIFHPDTPLANKLEGYNFLYVVTRDDNAATIDKNGIDHTMHIPRPRNKWILYRQEKSQEILRERTSLSAGEISKIVAEMWKNESEEVRAFWTRKAKEEELIHKEKYPDSQSSGNKAKKGPAKTEPLASHIPDSG